MTKVVVKPLPHGAIPFEQIPDPNMKRAVMLNNENVKELKRQLAENQIATQELQRKPTYVPTESEEAAAQAKVAAEAAKNSATSASSSATTATAASNSALASSTLAESAKAASGTSAQSASESASSAQASSNSASLSALAASRDAAAAAESARIASAYGISEYGSFGIFGTLISSNSAFFMQGLVQGTTANDSYSVTITFYNTSNTERTVKVNEESIRLDGALGATASKTLTVSGNGSFTIHNSIASVNVFVKYTKVVK